MSEPTLQIPDDRSRDLVLKEISPDAAQRYHEKVKGGGWESIRGVIYIVLLVAAVFLFLTQPELYKVVIGMITTFAAGPPLLQKLLSFAEPAKTKNIG